jgi:hypothetical protein
MTPMTASYLTQLFRARCRNNPRQHIMKYRHTELSNQTLQRVFLHIRLDQEPR